LRRDRPRDEAAEAGVDAVDVVTLVRASLDDRPRGAHLPACLVGELGGRTPVSDGPDVLETKVVPGQADRCRLGHGAESSSGLRADYRSRSRSSTTREASKPSIRRIAPAAATAAPAGIRPTSSEPATSAPRASASAATRPTISCSAAA